MLAMILSSRVVLVLNTSVLLMAACRPLHAQVNRPHGMSARVTLRLRLPRLLVRCIYLLDNSYMHRCLNSHIGLAHTLIYRCSWITSCGRMWSYQSLQLHNVLAVCPSFEAGRSARSSSTRCHQTISAAERRKRGAGTA